jgi:DNA processing protein
MKPDDEARAHAAALAGLPAMTPVRLAKLLDGFHPVMAWRAVQAGAHPADPDRRFARGAGTTDVDEVWASYRRCGTMVLLPREPGYPSMLLGDPGAPAVLFARGDPTVVEGAARVAIVGTRSATPYGRQVASELASDLAAAGVIVVSGLARGIDGAAHAGALRGGGTASAPPVAVVGTGLDTVYPATNRELWEAVASRGAVLSEAALGTKPHPGVFPARNRIIAALSDVVVVVESHRGGGSLYTAEAAARRSIPVCAVPGSVKSRASQGTNGLLVDGCAPVRDAEDVLVAISLARAAKYESHPELLATQAQTDDERRDSDRLNGVSGPVVDHGGPRPDAASEQVPATAPPPTAPPTAAAPLRRAQANDARTNERPNARSGAPRSRGGRRSDRVPQRRAQIMTQNSPDECAVLDAVDDVPTTFETILIRTDLSVTAAAAACDHLVESGALLAGAGWWSRNLEPVRNC